MPEYLAPGVYVEEVSFRAKPIEGVSTSTTGFAGLALSGPTGTTELLTSFNDYERIYGGTADLTLGGAKAVNYLSHAVRGFFNNGGRRLYVSRVFVEGGNDGIGTSPWMIGDPDPNNAGDPHPNGDARFVARFPGSSGNGTVSLTETSSPAAPASLAAAPTGTMVVVLDDPAASPPAPAGPYVKEADGEYRNAAAAVLDYNTEVNVRNHTVNFVSLAVVTEDASGLLNSYDDLAYSADHPRGIMHMLAEDPARRIAYLENRFAIAFSNDVADLTPIELRTALLGGTSAAVHTIAGGNDGGVPSTADYESALEVFEQLENISIVATPGGQTHNNPVTDQGVANALISHCERRRAYRIGILDTPHDLALSEVAAFRSLFDSTYAALYWPQVVIPNPNVRPGDESQPSTLTVPASGFLAGIYARNDNTRGVWKSPANEVVRGALRFSFNINFAQNEFLNPQGINALRFFPGRGNRVWGARTATSDGEWKYVSVRRFFIFVEQSIDNSTQYAVFEPNGPQLWGNITKSVSDFLETLWLQGALLGSKPSEAYFVRCDRSTMTQNDLDNGRMICEIGMAVVKPAEFVIFRIGQKTTDARA